MAGGFELMLRDRELWLTIAAGLFLGALGVLLSVWGNPENSGICVSCFLENSAGALGLHDKAGMQYLRPELIGFVFGSTASALFFREFSPRGGSASLSRFFLGVFMIFGCAVFIGCPIKLFLRLAAGDLTAVAGVVGLVVGVWVGLKGLVNGVEFARATPGRASGGFLMPVLFVLLLVLFVARPDFLLFSERGSAAQHAPWMIALASSTVLGMLAQRTGFCITGSIRNTFLMGMKVPAFMGLLAFVFAALVLNIGTNRFNPGLYGQPGAHLEFVWSFLGMGLVGWISVLIAGCPFRQLIRAGEGDADAGLVVAGMLLGGALAQAWGIAATAAGVPYYGKVAIVVGYVFIIGSSLMFRVREH
jgi:YedE family putative selenium metabolism protein